jgi:hypothetical protein
MESISRTKSSDFGGELKIANGAATRWVENEGREKERRKKEEGRGAIFYRRVVPW